jgi:hypothetical protein
MPWWGWLALGAGLLGAEIAVQTEFWLALVGAAAMAVGLARTIGLDGPAWFQWIAFAALAIGFNALFRRRLHERFVGRAPGLAPELLGEAGVALEMIAPGAIGAVELRGTTWRARNVGATPVADRAPVKVAGTDGILLEVRQAP